MRHNCFWISFLFFPLCIFKALAQTPKWIEENPILNRAFILYQDTQKKNQKDLFLLKAQLKKSFKAHPLSFKKTKQQLTQKIKNDFLLLKQLKKANQHALKQGPLDFYSAIEELLGSRFHSSLLLETFFLFQKKGSKLLKKTFSFPKHFTQTRNITIYKTLFLYLIAIYEKTIPKKLISKLSLIYPAQIPVFIKKKTIQNFSFFFKHPTLGPILLLPNAGYVLGAKQNQGGFHGGDCSFFASYAAHIPRLYTFEMELIWKWNRLQKMFFQNILFSHMQHSFLNPRLQKAASLMNIVRFQKGAPQPGDLLLWRWGRKHKSRGHVSIFAKTFSKTSFLGFESTRQYRKRQEGIFFHLILKKRFSKKKQLRIYLLKRKPF